MDKDKIREEVDRSLGEGWKMAKIINRGSFLTSPTFDKRIVYDRKQLTKLISEGFELSVDAGVLALNILLRL